MTDIKNELTLGIEKITGHHVASEENLLKILDSLNLVELILLIDEVAKKQKTMIDMDALLTEEILTIQIIAKKLAPPL